MSRRKLARKPKNSSKQNNPSGSKVLSLIKNAAPTATTFGISRVGSKVLSTPIISKVENPAVVRFVPFSVSLLFILVAHLGTKSKALSKYRSPALVGSSVNSLLTLISALSSQAKGLLNLAGYDYSHVPEKKETEKEEEIVPTSGWKF